MKQRRDTRAGTTLIEMLLALAVFSLIGVAGFVLLDGVTRNQTKVTDTMQRISRQDRAFRLFTQDVETAQSAQIKESGALELVYSKHIISWSASDQSVLRRIQAVNGPSISQVVLEEAAQLEITAQGLTRLYLRQAGVWRLAAVPGLRQP